MNALSRQAGNIAAAQGTGGTLQHQDPYLAYVITANSVNLHLSTYSGGFLLDIYNINNPNGLEEFWFNQGECTVAISR